MSDPVSYNIRATENQSGIYTAKLLDESGNALGSSALTSLTLTLYDKVSTNIINSRTSQNILNANQVTLDAYGKLTWYWLPLDMILVDTTKLTETHIALFEAKWLDTDSRLRQLNHEVIFVVNSISNLS